MKISWNGFLCLFWVIYFDVCNSILEISICMNSCVRATQIRILWGMNFYKCWCLFEYIWNMVLLIMMHESMMIGKVHVGLALPFALVITKRVIIVGLISIGWIGDQIWIEETSSWTQVNELSGRICEKGTCGPSKLWNPCGFESGCIEHVVGIEKDMKLLWLWSEQVKRIKKFIRKLSLRGFCFPLL